VDHSPAFGQADLTNCERELIHLAGSIQPHGALLVLRERDGLLVQASANCASLLGLPADRLLMRPLSVLGGDLDARVRLLSAVPDLTDPRPLQAHTEVDGSTREWLLMLHRVPGQGVLALEFEAPGGGGGDDVRVSEQPGLMERLSESVQRFSQAATLNALCDGISRSVRDLTGYDRVMVYKFDPDGHGKIIAEARHPRLDSLLGHQYPATDIPQRARALYLANRVRVLVDVHYAPVPLVPVQLPADPDGGRPEAAELDMSMCALRSMSPLHLQYLKNMGVTGTLVVSLVREGRLWGLIAAHHDSPRAISPVLRAACDLLAEVAATRIAAIENYAHAQVAILVRRLEQRLVEATSTEGDWRLALFRNPRTLLQPLEASGAALFAEGEVLTVGEVPSTPELRELQRWVDAQPVTDGPFACSSVAKANPSLDSLTPTASGVLAVRLSASQSDYLMWFRKEQLLTVTWAGDPSKPMVGDDPLTLSPRRSFAAWSELVRGTALPWTSADLALGRAIGLALVDIIVQVHAVRLLVAEHQLAGIRRTVQHSGEPVLIANARGELLFCNPAFHGLTGRHDAELHSLQDLPQLFTKPATITQALSALQRGQPTWRGESALLRTGSEPVPVSVRAEAVPGRDGQPLGFVVTLFDLSHNKRAAEARQHLEQSMRQSMQMAQHRGRAAAGADPATTDPLLGAILTNASLAAMDIADGTLGAPVAPLLQELEVSTQRAATLYGLIRSLSGDDAQSTG